MKIIVKLFFKILFNKIKRFFSKSKGYAKAIDPDDIDINY